MTNGSGAQNSMSNNDQPESLADFLLARIAEDEAATVGKDMAGVALGAVEAAPGYAECSISAPRVLAECQAKRQIIDDLSRHDDLGISQGATEHLLGILALPYADHPDFREEWRP